MKYIFGCFYILYEKIVPENTNLVTQIFQKFLFNFKHNKEQLWINTLKTEWKERTFDA